MVLVAYDWCAQPCAEFAQVEDSSNFLGLNSELEGVFIILFQIGQ
jgi:hypothetical protein